MAPVKNRSSLNPPRWQLPGLCLLLAAITFAVFGQTAGFGFVNYDDNVYVYENARVAGGLSMKGLAWAFTHADCDLYHPLTMLSLMADDQLHGLHAGGFHFTNVLLHAAAVVLLFLVLHQMTGALWRSAFVAAVFAIHPLRAESVAWVAERKDVLSGFFFMLTLGAYVYYVRKPNSLARYLTVAGAFVLALLSKPTVVTLPLVLLLLDYWPLQRAESVRRLILEKIPLLALAAGTGVVTVLAAGDSISANANASILSRLGNVMVSAAVYLRQTIWPEGLAAYYPQPEKGYPLWTIVLSFLVLALITGGVLVFRRKHPWLLAGWLWYLGMLTPMLGIIQAGGFAHADRMTYLPQIGICVALTWLAAEWRASRAVFGGLMTGVLAVLMFCAWKQTAYWKNSETLWSHALACTTDNKAARLNLGSVFLQTGKVDEAIALFQESLQSNPDNAEEHLNLGAAFLQKGSVDEAITHFEKALQLKPDFVEAHLSLANIFFQQGRMDEAIPHYQKALQINPGLADVHGRLGIALFKSGNKDEALSQFHSALQLKPGDAEAQFNLGNALCQMGKADEAVPYLQTALLLKPDFVAAHLSLGNAFSRQGRIAEAMTQYKAAGRQDLAEKLDGELQRDKAGLPLHQ